MRVRTLRYSAILVTLNLILAMVMGATAAADPTITEYPITTGSSPAGIIAGADGNLWFTEFFKNQIAKLTPTGTITEYLIPTANSGPDGITSGPDGNLWFTERFANKVAKITPTGTITEYSVPTSDSEPLDITSGPDGNLWFTELFGYIGKLTPTGSFTEYPTPSIPLDITSGPDGNLWFTEQGANKVAKITPTGTIIEYSVPTSDSEPSGITSGPDGSIWFTELNGNRIAKITSTGTVTEYALAIYNSAPLDITSGPDGNLWFIERGVHAMAASTPSVAKITPTGAISEYPIPTSNSGPDDITSGPDGNLWFTEFDANQIGKIVLASVPATPTSLTATSPVQYPTLNWTAPSGATSYNIYRNGTNIGSTTSTTYPDNTAPEGTDTYYVTAINSSGESGPSNSVNVLVDRTAPTITYTVSPTPNSAGWNNSSPVTVTFTCTDNSGGSGIASCSSPQTESTDGQYTLSGIAVDNAGNSSSVSVNINLDQTAPTLGTPTWSTNPILVGSGNSTLTVPASDNLSGVASGEYYIGGTDPGVGNGIAMTYSSGNLTAAIGANLSAGVYTISYRAKDVAGNWSAVTPSTQTMLVITDPSTTLGISGKNKKDLVPSTTNGDVMPGLVNGATDAADYGMTVQYKNGVLDSKNGFVFNYSTGGTNCGKQNAQNCQTFSLTATSFDWMTTGGTNNSQAWFQGTANVTVNGVTTTNKFWVEATDGNRLTPTTNNYLTLKVYAPGADPATATPIYQASGSMSSTNSVKIQ